MKDKRKDKRDRRDKRGTRGTKGDVPYVSSLSVPRKREVKTIFVIDEIIAEDLEEALALVWKVFLAFEAPDYEEEGVQEFRRFIDFESIKQKLERNEFHMWVCRDKEKIVGVLAIRPPCHISLLFVDEKYHRMGIARKMLDHVICIYRQDNGLVEITVNSSPFAQEAYHRLGFRDTDVEKTVNGIRFVPMLLTEPVA